MTSRYVRPLCVWPTANQEPNSIIVNLCPLANFGGGLQYLHEAIDQAVRPTGVYSNYNTPK